MSDRWDVLRLQDGALELLILPGIGGRLWDVVFHGRSLLFQNPDLIGHALDGADVSSLPTRSPQFGFPLWGGEKTWVAPDTLWKDGAPFPALDSDAYRVVSVSGAHVELASEICPISELSVTRRITLNSASDWRIEHTVVNCGASERRTGIWSVMMIDAPAKIGVAMDMPEVRPVFGDAGSMVSHARACVVADCATPHEFKVGLPNPTGQTFIKLGNGTAWILCSTPAPASSETFAHHHPVEIFNSGDYAYCEAEWHSPQANLQPGQALSFQQDFQIWPDGDPVQSVHSKELLTCMS